MIKLCSTCKYVENTFYKFPCNTCDVATHSNWELKELENKEIIEDTAPNKETNFGGKKFDDNKLRWELLPIEQVEKIVEILTFGSKKYGPNNWQNLDEFKNRYYAALMRHLCAWRKGEKLDSESKKQHLAHALTNILFLLWGEDNERL